MKNLYIGSLSDAVKFNHDNYYKSTIICVSTHLEDVTDYEYQRIIHIPIYRIFNGQKRVPDTVLSSVCLIILKSMQENRKTMVFSTSGDELAPLVAAFFISEVQTCTSLAMAYHLIKKIYPKTIEIMNVMSYQTVNPFTYPVFRNQVDLPKEFEKFKLDYPQCRHGPIKGNQNKK